MAQTITNALPAQTAGGSDSTTLCGEVTTVAGTNNAVVRCELIPPVGYTTSTHDATNNVAFTFNRKRSGTAVELCKVTTTATDLVAETVVTVPVTGTAANTTSLQQGDLIEVLMHQNGTGVAVGAGILAVLEIG